MGSIYALIAIGYSIVYSIMGLINFAHGELLMIATFATWSLMGAGLPFGLAVILAIAITIGVGVLIERVAYRPVRNRGEETQVITSLAVSILIESVYQSVYGSSNKSLIVPAFFSQRVQVAGITISVINVIIVAMTVLLLLGITLLLKKTRLGRAMRAVADNGEAADLMGIDRNMVIVSAFVIGSGLAAIAGIMYTGEYIAFSPTMGFMLGVKAFIAAVIGGLGSINGAALGGLVMGMLEMFFAVFLPGSILSYQTAIVFVVMIIILLVRPNGLLGTDKGRRS